MRPARDAVERNVIIDIVAGIDPGLGRDAIDAALASVTRNARSFRLIGRLLTEKPGLLVTGPTTCEPSIDEFVAALIRAGSTVIVDVHPVCVTCGQRRQAQIRRGSGWACWGCSTITATCDHCGAGFRVSAGTVTSGKRCHRCKRARNRQDRLDPINESIRAIIHDAVGGVDDVTIDAAAVAAGFTRPNRMELLVELRTGTDVGVAAERSPRVAVLLDRLRRAGADVPAAKCRDCHRAAEPLIIRWGEIRCRTCAKVCPRCKRAKKETSDELCARCTTPKGRVRGPCVDCVRTAVLLDVDRRCRLCREAANHVCAVCATNAPLRQRRCHRCLLADEFDSILGDTPLAWLVRLRSSVLAAANPTTTTIWLHDSPAGRLLLAFARGEQPLSHETLDQYSGRGIDHLRGLLVSVGGLEPDNRWIDRLEHDLREITNAIVDPTDRAVASGWVRWHGLARMRRRVEHGDSLVHSGWNLRTQTRQIVRFIGELHERERSVSSCTQTDIDSWFARPRTNTMHVRGFLNWATKHAHVPKGLTVPPSRSTMPPARDANHRWKVARRLVNDETISNSDRVLGALIVLYAQPLTRVVQLTTTDVRTDSNGVVTVTLGPVVLELPEPFAGLAVQLPERRRNGMNDQIPTAWLFPGNTAARHTTVNTLSTRLRRLDISPREMRGAALGQLAAEIPPAVLASTVGISATTATRWAAITGGDWTRYARDPDGPGTHNAERLGF